MDWDLIHLGRPVTSESWLDMEGTASGYGVGFDSSWFIQSRLSHGWTTEGIVGAYGLGFDSSGSSSHV